MGGMHAGRGANDGKNILANLKTHFYNDIFVLHSKPLPWDFQSLCPQGSAQYIS